MSLPTPHHEPERYEEKPLLIVLENYVLDTIGELPIDRQVGVRQIVQNVFGGDDDWRRTVRSRLALPDTLDDALRQAWQQNQDLARQNEVDLHPVHFAKMIVDTSFAHLVS